MFTRTTAAAPTSGHATPVESASRTRTQLHLQLALGNAATALWDETAGSITATPMRRLEGKLRSNASSDVWRFQYTKDSADRFQTTSRCVKACLRHSRGLLTWPVWKDGVALSIFVGTM